MFNFSYLKVVSYLSEIEFKREVAPAVSRRQVRFSDFWMPVSWKRFSESPRGFPDGFSILKNQVLVATLCAIHTIGAFKGEKSAQWSWKCTNRLTLRIRSENEETHCCRAVEEFVNETVLAFVSHSDW